MTRADPIWGAAERGFQQAARCPPPSKSPGSSHSLSPAVHTHTPSAQSICHWGCSYCVDIRAGACKFLISTSFLIPATTVPSRHMRHTQQTPHTHQVDIPDTHTGYTCSSFSKQWEIPVCLSSSLNLQTQ